MYECICLTCVDFFPLKECFKELNVEEYICVSVYRVS